MFIRITSETTKNKMTTPDYKFDNYLKEKKNNDIQKNITEINENLFKTGEKFNIIYYGPNGVGKYSCALDYVSHFSPSCLTYEKKIIIETTKGQIVIKISDKHFEVDFGLLGVNSKQMWNDIIQHINDVLSIRKDKQAFILCKNFNEIHSELLDIFYSYMQTTNRKTYINFILLTNSTGFIPKQILNKCLVIGVPRPSKPLYSSIRKIGKCEVININEIDNINLFKNCQTNKLQRIIVEQLVEKIENIRQYDYSVVRDNIYDIFVSNYNVWTIIWGIIEELINRNRIPEEKVSDVLKEVYCFLELYNNNYRPIYHLERFVYFLAITINEL